MRSVEPLEVFAARVAGVLGMQFMGDRRSGTGEMAYRMRGRTFDDWIGVFVGPNYFAPEPGETQAMDGYPVMLDVQCRVRKPDQKEEARLAFEALIQSMPEVPALLVHQVTMLVAAHLPGTDTHYFGPDVTVDDPDADVWRPWVVG